MKRLLAVFGVVCSLLGSPAQADDASDRAQVLKASEAVVQIHVMGLSFGSGWFINSDTIITNCHVVDGATIKNIVAIRIPTKRVPSFTAIIKSCNKYQDIAVLKVVGDYKSPVHVEMYNRVEDLFPQKMDKVWAVGYPAGGSQIITEGFFQFQEKLSTNSYTCIFTDAPIHGGNSGGALFWISPTTKRAVLLGMPSASLRAYHHINCAVRAIDIEYYLDAGAPNGPISDGTTKKPGYFYEEEDTEKATY